MCPPGRTKFFFSCHLMQTHSSDYLTEDLSKHEFVKDVYIYKNMVLKRVKLTKINYIEREVNRKLFDKNYKPVNINIIPRD